jgi:hypothetical protein
LAGILTVSERIQFHLNNYLKFEDKYEVPFDVTQDGISQACAISRAHAAIELKKLKASGVILEKLSHVRKGKARRKTYFLTFEGKARAAKVCQGEPGQSDGRRVEDRARTVPFAHPLFEKIVGPPHGRGILRA